MMIREKHFPFFFIVNPDRMVFEMAVGINRFPVTEPAINISTGIGRIVDDGKDTAVGQGPP